MKYIHRWVHHTEWTEWFAWHPVVAFTNDGLATVWLETVERRYSNEDETYLRCWEYRVRS